MSVILFAQDREDLEVISARLQDALVTVGDIKYLPSSRRFAAMFSRFMWEEEAGGRKPNGQGAKKAHRRVRAGLSFADVTAVKAKGVDMKKPRSFLSLLAVVYHPATPPSTSEGSEAEEAAPVPVGGEVELLFAGGATLRLAVDCLEAELRDAGEPWKTGSRPDHDIEEAGSPAGGR